MYTFLYFRKKFEIFHTWVGTPTPLSCKKQDEVIPVSTE